MRYRKFKADNIFNGDKLLAGDNVLIVDEKGAVEDIVAATDAGDDVQPLNGILSPGFINCHCHLELSHMKNVVETGTGLVDFLINVVGKRGFEKAIIDEAIQAADAEMYNNGIVAVGDICNTTGSVQTKLNSKIAYHNFIEVIGFTEENAGNVFERFFTVYNNFLTAGLQNNSIVPHAPYTISSAMFSLINNASANKIISIHNQETPAEDELYKTKTGDFFRLYHHLNINTDFFKAYNKTSLQSYLPLLNMPAAILLVHNTNSTQPDIDFALGQSNKLNQQIHWCLCPNANLYIENNLPPVELLINNNCNIVLGTDSYSSNTYLSILEEMKTLQQHFPVIKLEAMLKWATANGAAALNMNDTIGSFEKGKKPGVVLIENVADGCLTHLSSARRLL